MFTMHVERTGSDGQHDPHGGYRRRGQVDVTTCNVDSVDFFCMDSSKDHVNNKY